VGLYINRIIEAGRPDILAPIPPTAIDRLREAVILTATLAKVDGRRFEIEQAVCEEFLVRTELALGDDDRAAPSSSQSWSWN
jgi:hypothetical protein